MSLILCDLWDFPHKGLNEPVEFFMNYSWKKVQWVGYQWPIWSKSIHKINCVFQMICLELNVCHKFFSGRLLMTPFRQLVVPPPMSAYYLQLPAHVNLVSFCCHGNTDDVLVLLDDGRVAVYRFKGKSFGINTSMWKYEKKILFSKKNGKNDKYTVCNIKFFDFYDHIHKNLVNINIKKSQKLKHLC